MLLCDFLGEVLDKNACLLVELFLVEGFGCQNHTLEFFLIYFALVKNFGCLSN